MQLLTNHELTPQRSDCMSRQSQILLKPEEADMRNLLVTLHSRSVITLALTLLFPITGTVYGQTATGSISGTVSDPSGSAVPGSRVNLTNVGRNESRSAKASDSGYVF